MSEKHFTEQVLELAETLGWRCAHFHDSRRQVRPGIFVGDKAAKGFPDLVLVKGFRLIFAELKVGKNKTTEAQREWLADLETVAQFTESSNAPASVEVYEWRPEQMAEIAALLRPGARRVVQGA